MRTTIFAILLSCASAMAQLPTLPIPAAASSSFNYGNLYLYVNAASANGTNIAAEDIVTNVWDWGTNNWTLAFSGGPKARIKTDIMSNSLPCILQTNFGSGVNGGVALPNPWMGSTDTNFTVTMVALFKLPPGASTPWILGDVNGADGYSLLGQTTGKNLESWDEGGTIDVTSANVVQTNVWVIYTVVHASALVKVYTNNVLLISGGPGITKAIGHVAGSLPRFFGSSLAGAQYWNGAWNRIMMWKYGISDADRTNYYTNLKSELGLTALP
jgi:hypothetical protein